MPSSVAGSAARPEWLTIPSRTGAVRLSPWPSRSSVSTTRSECSWCRNAVAEALPQTAVERLLADVTERRMAEVVAEADGLDQVLVQPQCAGDRPRDLGDLERVGQPGAVVVTARRHEHLGLVLEPPERLAVHDPVTIALKRRAQPAVRFGAHALRRIRTRGQRRQLCLLALAHAPLERVGDGAARMLIAGDQKSARSRSRF